MVHTIEIKRQNWPEFFRTLNRRAANQPVRLEVERRDLGSQEMGRHLPLREISLEEKGSERGDLTITVASEGGDLTHHVDRPVRLYAMYTEAVELEVVVVEEEDQSKTLLHFEHLPEIPAETYAG